MGDRDGEDGSLINLGLIAMLQGDFASASDHFDQALQIAHQIADRSGEALILADLSLLHLHMENYTLARSSGQEALRVALQFDDVRTQGFAWTHLGHAAIGLGEPAEARLAYQRALDIRRSLGLSRLCLEPLAGLAHAALLLGDLPAAQATASEILSYLQIDESAGSPALSAGDLEHALDGALEPFRVYLAVSRVLQAGAHPLARPFLAAVFACLQSRAASIPDAGLRQSFLANLPCHRAIIQLYEKSNL